MDDTRHSSKICIFQHGTVSPNELENEIRNSCDDYGGTTTTTCVTFQDLIPLLRDER